MKRHLETCTAAVDLARTTLQATDDLRNALSQILDDLLSVKEQLHLSLTACPGWPEPSEDHVRTLREAISRLSGQTTAAARAMAELREQADTLATDL